VDRFRNPRTACHAAILLAIVGVFGTWSTSGPVSLNGVEGSHNGWLVILFGLIALTGVRSLGRGGWLGIAAVLEGGAIMLYSSVSDLVAHNDIHWNSGWGIWLTIVMSGALVALAVYAAVERIRGNTPAGATTSS
jgi:CDP-diglyceride synthetase